MLQNFRKIFTIILSCLINKYNLTSRQFIGLIISIFGILINFKHNHPLLLQKIGCKRIRYYQEASLSSRSGWWSSWNIGPCL